MWICLSDAFLSIVAHRERRDCLLVRARAHGHIERVFPEAAVTHTPAADYPYRAVLTRARVGGVIAAHLGAIEYPNFKDSVAEPALHDAYLDLWSIMRGYQRGAARRRPPA